MTIYIGGNLVVDTTRAVMFNFFSCFIPPRFGWFIPSGFAQNIPPIKDHWRAFTSEKVSKLFAPDDQDWEFIRKQLTDKDGR